MSLVTLIRDEESYKIFFKQCIPSKTDFKTISGKLAFSKEYKLLAEYTLSRPHDSCVVGTAFDYIARWIIASYVEVNAYEALENLIAEKGVLYCRIIAKENNINVDDIYRKAIDKVKSFINGYTDKKKIIEIAIFFAKLEHIFRKGLGLYNIDLNYLLSVEEEIIADLESLYDVFEQKFIHNGIVNKNSTVIYNPTFGGASVICGGADADIFIDGTLYDFKCTKKCGYIWSDVAQLVGYYLLDNIAKKNKDNSNCLNGCDIKRVAFYRARYGEIEYFDVSEKMYKNQFDVFECMLGKDSYRIYLEQERKKQLKKREEEKERKYKQLKEKRKWELLLKRGRKNEIMLYKLKCLLELGDWVDESIKQCQTENERNVEIRELVDYCSDLNIAFKIDGERMQNIMNQNNITIEKISEATGRTPETVKRWIKEKSTPKAGACIKLLDTLGCKKDDIIKLSKS